MPRRTILSGLLTALLVLLTAGAASAIFLPCEDVCDYGGAPGYRNCTYYGQGSCPALPNPCYFSCDMYRSCTGGFVEGEDATEDLSAEPQLTLPLGASTEAWIEQLAGGFYGPCLLFLGPDSPEVEGVGEEGSGLPVATLELEDADR